MRAERELFWHGIARLLTVVLLTVTAAVALLRDDHPTPAHAASTTTTTRCTEDMSCWNWKTMGNHQRGVCIDGGMQIEQANGVVTATHPAPSTCTNAFETIQVGTELYDVNAPNRPACFVEPSATVEGYEVIFYPDMAKVPDDGFGFEVRCPG